MKLITTQSARHLAYNIPLEKIDYTIKHFSDGELYLKLNQAVQHEDIWILTSTQAPADNLLELCFLLDALERWQARSIRIFFSYFAYARQTRAASGEALSAHVISTLLTPYQVTHTHILHAHAAAELESFLPFTNEIDFDFFCTAAKDVDIIAAPDHGAAQFAQKVASKAHKDVIYLNKRRPEHEKVIIEMTNAEVNGKRILIVDDIISTGNTLMQAARQLRSAGATYIAAAATHGLCSTATYHALAQSFEAIHVTDSIAQKKREGVQVYPCANFIYNIMQRIHHS